MTNTRPAAYAHTYAPPAYRTDIQAMQDAGFSVQWGHWSLTACRMANGWPISDVVAVNWPVGVCGPVDAELSIRNRVAAELRTKCGI